MMCVQPFAVCAVLCGPTPGNPTSRAVLMLSRNLPKAKESKGCEGEKQKAARASEAEVQNVSVVKTVCEFISGSLPAEEAIQDLAGKGA